MASVRLLEKAECRYKIVSAKPLRLESNLRRREVSNVGCRDDLRQLASLIDLLSPDRDDPESFYLKKNLVACELRRLAKWRPHFVIGAPKCRAKEPTPGNLATY